MKAHIIAPSILATDFTHLASDITLINNSDAAWIHVDVMDGHFVPNISFGIPIVMAVRGLTEKIVDVHLMIERPERYISRFREAGADIISVHYEACPHLHRVVQQIRMTGAQVGVALNPHTDIRLLDDVLEDLDLVLLMSVNPGFGGQKFIYRTLSKIERIKSRIIERNLSTRIEIDGGVGLQNAEACLRAGADVLVAGSSVFKSDDPVDTIHRLSTIGGAVGV